MSAGIQPERSLQLANAEDADWFSFHYKQLSLFYNPESAADFLKTRGILIYPTETFYAIGCCGNNETSAQTVMTLKRRRSVKPMPLLAASKEQAHLAVKLSACTDVLTDKFWPGPLTVILPAKPTVANPCKDAANYAAIRVSCAFSARSLAGFCDFPISSSSANFSGAAPATTLRQLDPQFLENCNNARCGLALWLEPQSNSRLLPSTIVKPESAKVLRLIREGVVSKLRLQTENFIVI